MQHHKGKSYFKENKGKLVGPRSKNLLFFQTQPMHEHAAMPFISRPMNDSLFPPFAKPGMGQRSNTPRDAKKDGRNMGMGGKK